MVDFVDPVVGRMWTVKVFALAVVLLVDAATAQTTMSYFTDETTFVNDAQTVPNTSTNATLSSLTYEGFQG